MKDFYFKEQFNKKSGWLGFLFALSLVIVMTSSVSSGEEVCTYWCKVLKPYQYYYCCDYDPIYPPNTAQDCPRFCLPIWEPRKECWKDNDCCFAEKCCYDVCSGMKVCKRS
ncbi:UNVERIFIED_CONTAM: hypothetical protein RMT77_015930 [Armadillidium vulgare]